MAAAFGSLAYPFGGGGYADGCGCRWACFPQIHARFDNAHLTREKYGFEEFTAVSTPRRRYLTAYTSTTFLANGARYTTWERTVIDPATGEETTTASDPATITVYFNTSPTVTTTTLRTLQRTVTKGLELSTGAPIIIQTITVLSDENTTARLQADVRAALPEWGTFPTAPAGLDGQEALVNTTDQCYVPGTALWDLGYRSSIPGIWRLPNDELSFTLQRVRYKLTFPPLLGPASTFTVEWEEVFIPDDAEDEEDWIVLAHVSCSGGASDAESDVLEITERYENGRVFLRNARYTALG